MRHTQSILTLRSGRVERGAVVLLLGAAISLAMIVFAISMLLDTYGSNAQEPVPDPIAAQTDLGTQAPSETVERVLESVQVYVSDEDFAPAMTILDRAVARYPNDTDLRLALADLHMRVQDFEGAYDQYATVLASSETPNAALSFTAGTLASEVGRQELAEQHFSEAFRAEPTNADYALYLANVQLTLNKPEEASANAAIAARIAPRRVEPWVTWSHAAMRQNDPEQAITHVRKAREIQPDVILWAVLEAKALTRLGRASEAVETLAAFPSEALTDRDPAMTLARAYAMLDRPKDAAQRVVAAARAHMDDGSLALDAAIWLERAGDRDLAVLWARRAEELGSTRARPWIDALD